MPTEQATAPDAGTSAEEPPDAVNHPPHYNQGGVECIDALRAALGAEGFAGFCRGNAIKYLWRAGLKGNPAEDVAKARWYVDRLHAQLSEADRGNDQ